MQQCDVTITVADLLLSWFVGLSVFGFPRVAPPPLGGDEGKSSGGVQRDKGESPL